jgi:hypothetical protein
MITDIRKSNSLSDFDLLTAIVLSSDSHGKGHIHTPAKEISNGLLILESASAEKDQPEIGVRCGDQFLRMWIKPDHGFNVGDEISLH